ncbi:MAG: di-heme oxidoredictase family protein [Thermoanaerobaculia bacterium]
MESKSIVTIAALGTLLVAGAAWNAELGREVAIPRHLADGEEFEISLRALIDHGKALFDAVWTAQEGGGRPQVKGTGAPLADPSSPLEFPRDFNRISAPDANACSGCHNFPRGGGGGDIVANVFVLGQRFDFATFDSTDPVPTRGGVDEAGNPVELQTIANSRNTLGMFGSGFIEMLSRQMTAELQAIRDGIAPGGSAELLTKGISCGVLARDGGGNWDTSGVTGLPAPSLASTGPGDPPSLALRPFHQVSNVVSLRQFSNNAFNHHHGIQSTERFGIGTDPDDDGFTDEMTRADVTAVSVFQAQLAAPGRVIPRDPEIEQAVRDGEAAFAAAGCTRCHVPALPLADEGWIFVEPNPFNPPGNLGPGDAPDLAFDLTDWRLDLPRLRPAHGSNVLWVPAFTDLQLHDITAGPGDPNRELLDQNQPAGSPGFFAGNGSFLSRKLWGIGNEPPFFHHGQFTTMRQAIEAHAGEAEPERQAWEALSDSERDAVIEFLKTLQILPQGSRFRIVDHRFRPRFWNSPLFGWLGPDGVIRNPPVDTW